jgi:hypothetical protein
MDFEITQKQDKELLKEHANSSYNFTFIGRYEWILATMFLITGFIVLIGFESIKIAGFIFIGIGILELIKFPSRIDRWVNKKVKETIFNKEIRYVLSDNDLKISFDDIIKVHKYQNMRQCLISDTGLLFKISYAEYYYISFRYVDSKYSKMELITFIKSRFDNRMIKIKNMEFNGRI